MAQKGRTIALAVGIYLIAKSILNLVIGGFSLGNLVTLGLMTGLAAILNLRVKYAHIITAAVSLLLVLLYLPGNLSGFPGTWLYLTEGIIDVAAAVLLLASPDVKAFMSEGKDA